MARALRAWPWRPSASARGGFRCAGWCWRDSWAARSCSTAKTDKNNALPSISKEGGRKTRVRVCACVCVFFFSSSCYHQIPLHWTAGNRAQFDRRKGNGLLRVRCTLLPLDLNSTALLSLYRKARIRPVCWRRSLPLAIFDAKWPMLDRSTRPLFLRAGCWAGRSLGVVLRSWPGGVRFRAMRAPLLLRSL